MINSKALILIALSLASSLSFAAPSLQSASDSADMLSNLLAANPRNFKCSFSLNGTKTAEGVVDAVTLFKSSHTIEGSFGVADTIQLPDAYSVMATAAGYTLTFQIQKGQNEFKNSQASMQRTVSVSLNKKMTKITSLESRESIIDPNAEYGSVERHGAISCL